MAVVVAASFHNGDLAILVDRKKVMSALRRKDRINGNPNIAIGSVFKADGSRQTRSEFAMYLGFSCSGTDGPPTDQVGNVLRRNGIEKLGSCSDACLINSNQ